MHRITGKIVTGVVTWAILAACATITSAAPPFGGPDSVAYAGKLWAAMASRQLVGDQPMWSKPYQGTPPHGAVLDTLHGKLTVGRHTGEAIIKRNYRGEGISVQKVADDPDEWLESVTVMFKREKGYDPEDQDWFWAKFNPDGSLQKNPKGMALAGRVAKGALKGCIACHRGAPGGDFVYGWNGYE